MQFYKTNLSCEAIRTEHSDQTFDFFNLVAQYLGEHVMLDKERTILTIKLVGITNYSSSGELVYNTGKYII